jgi:hypothetical protein
VSTYDVVQAVVVASIVGAALVSAWRRWRPRASAGGACGPAPCSTCGGCAASPAGQETARAAARRIDLRTIA